MKKVLFLSTDADMMMRFKMAFEGVYEAKCMIIGADDMARDVGKFKPDVIFIYAEGITRQKLFILEDLRENPRFSNIPLLLMADDKSTETITQQVKPAPDFTMPDDTTAMNVIRYIDRMVAATTRTKVILAVDDNLDDLKVLKHILEGTYKVTCVQSGAQALKFIEKQTPDCIILDCFMPEMDGPETLRRIRISDPSRNIQTLFITDNPEKEMVMRCLKLYPGGFMVKPIKRVELLKRLEEIL